MPAGGFYPADAPSFRTKYGHELKNQKWYREKLHLWNDPIHTGSVAWRLFHAPRIAQDLAVSERLDVIRLANEDEKQRLATLKHIHDETRTRVDCQRSDQILKTTAQSFDQVRHFVVPRLRSEFSAYPRTNNFSDFTLTINKFRKQAVTETVLQGDAAALEHVRDILRSEKQYGNILTSWESHRRKIIRDDFHERQQFIDKLSRMSGQLVVHNSPKIQEPVSDRIQALAAPKPKRAVSTPREILDCRGLLGIPRSRKVPPVTEPAPSPIPNPDFSRTRALANDLEVFEESLKGFDLEPKATGALDFTLPPKKRTLKVR